MRLTRGPAGNRTTTGSLPTEPRGHLQQGKRVAGFKGWLEKFASWLCLVHDSHAQELKEAMNLPYPVVIVNQNQIIRSRRLFHLLQQSFSGYSRVNNVVKSQIAFYGIQEANGFELLRLLRREFSLMSRPEALQTEKPA